MARSDYPGAATNWTFVNMARAAALLLTPDNLKMASKLQLSCLQELAVLLLYPSQGVLSTFVLDWTLYVKCSYQSYISRLSAPHVIDIEGCSTLIMVVAA